MKVSQNNNLKLGIIGAGFVGGSVVAGFDKNVEQFVVDTKLNHNTIDDLIEFDPSITFVCVPTPQTIGHTDVDVSIVRQVLSDLYDRNYKGIVVIKSTITPKHLTSSVKIVPTFKTDLITASLIKYTINSWLATKVSFFNDLYNLHKESGSSATWDQFTDMLKADSRIGQSHMTVPGPDGEFGFGGHCFPKDTEALLHYAQQSGVSMKILQKAVDTNKKRRS